MCFFFAISMNMVMILIVMVVVVFIIRFIQFSFLVQVDYLFVVYLNVRFFVRVLMLL